MKRTKILIILGLIVIILPVGVTFSKYVVENVKNYIMEANHFFFNSDKLVDGGITYEMNNWGGTSNIRLEFELNNHKNNALTSDADITYSIELDYDEDDITCSLSSYSGVIQKNEKTDSFDLLITPRRAFTDNESVSVTVTATSSSPYEKVLSATFIIIVGRRGIDYEIVDKRNQPYLIFKITNALDTYKVVTPFGDYGANAPLTMNEYMALSDANKAKCASAVITLSFSPANVILDTTSEIMKVGTFTTTNYNGINYISSITFPMDALTSMDIRFYKINSNANYTYNGTGTPIITFNAS